MDNLEKRLREDAERINVRVSPELDDRIRASLEGIVPETPARPERRKSPLSLWWASSLTGIAAAAAVILFVNLDKPPAPPVVSGSPPRVEPLLEPVLNPEIAVFTAPLQQELEDLESDLRKAEQAVREEFERKP